MRSIIISGGKAPSLQLLKNYLKEEHFIIASDSGAEATLKYNLTPNMIVGDLDSISEDTYMYYLNKGCKFIY